MSDNFKKRILTSSALIILILTMLNNKFFLVYFLILVTVISSLEFNQIIQLLQFKSKVTKNIFIYTFFSYLLFFSYLCFTQIISSTESKVLLIYVLSICVLSDIGGLVFGKIFKGPKLIKISPKKTYAGSFGSFFMSIILVIFFTKFYTLNTSFVIFLSITLLICFLCQTGDIFFSYLKRKAKLKDSGNILPGHGGLLDRVEGILLAFPFGLLLLSMYKINLIL